MSDTKNQETLNHLYEIKESLKIKEVIFTYELGDFLDLQEQIIDGIDDLTFVKSLAATTQNTDLISNFLAINPITFKEEIIQRKQELIVKIKKSIENGTGRIKSIILGQGQGMIRKNRANWCKSNSIILKLEGYDTVIVLDKSYGGGFQSVSLLGVKTE